MARGVIDGAVEHWLVTPERVGDVTAALADRTGRESRVKLIDLVAGESYESMPLDEVSGAFEGRGDGVDSSRDRLALISFSVGSTLPDIR